MKFIAEIDIMPHKELLDPQGKTVAHSMKNIHIDGIEDLHIGKHISMTLQANSDDEARGKVDTACQKLLANLMIETYSFFVYVYEEELISGGVNDQKEEE